MRTFSFLDFNNRQVREIQARDARRSALKWASRGYVDIYVIDNELMKMHVYKGGMREIKDEEKTDFTEKHNICRKPDVEKTAYIKLHPGMNLADYDEMSRLISNTF